MENKIGYGKKFLKSNQNPMQTIKDIINSPEPLAFLIGSGISVPSPSNLPSWEKFNKEILKIISPDDYTKAKLEQLVKNAKSPDRENRWDFLRFEWLIQQFYDSWDQNLSILDYLLLSEEPNVNHYMLAELINKWHYVFTTNFDVLIELASKKKKVSQIIRNDEFKDYLENRDKYENPLFKLHGSLKEYKNGEWINSKDSLQATLDTVWKTEWDLQFEEWKFEVFRDVLQKCNLIIMWYSGYDDFDVWPMIKYIKSDKKIVWVNHKEKHEEYKEYTMQEILNSEKDKSSEYLEKRFEILGELHSRGKRNENDILLVDADSGNVWKRIIESHGLDIPNFRDKVWVWDEVFGEFFEDWGKKIFGDEWRKENLCGNIFYSLERYDEALEEFEKALKISKELWDENRIAVNLNSIGVFHKNKSNYGKSFRVFWKKFRNI